MADPYASEYSPEEEHANVWSAGVPAIVAFGAGLVMLYATPVFNGLSAWVFGWLLAGGIAYTLGTVFYLHKRMPYAHAVWHGFVALGTACHCIAIWALVVPPA